MTDLHLGEHVLRQRWFAGTGPVEVVRDEALTPELRRVEAVTEEGARYQLVLGRKPAAEADSVGAQALVGVQGDDLWIDATVDPALSIALLGIVDAGEVVTTARPVSVEQSNTSVVYDERLILKVFRRLIGPSPEVEVTTALAATGFPNIAAPLAVWRDGDDDLALLQPYLTAAVEGWALAITSVRDALGSDEEMDPSERGGDLGPEAGRLGEVTAELHLAMADAFGVGPAEPKVWADAMVARAEAVDHPDVDRAAVVEVFEKVREVDDAGVSTRIHGDLHLGQVIRTDEGWFILDFEGEPTRPVEERRQPSSPLRDVAGMLRSFSYAAAVGAREYPDPSRAVAWEARNRAAFLERYFTRLVGSDLLPGDMGATLALLGAFELDKAVYEVGYEQAHRPDWVDIPLTAVHRLVAS